MMLGAQDMVRLAAGYVHLVNPQTVPTVPYPQLVPGGCSYD